MQIYFDTNIYRFIRSRDELRSMRKLLKALQCKLVASSENLFETFAITSPGEAHDELEVLTRLADRFETKPQSWFHAMELRDELRRYRPSWMRKVTFTRRAQDFLRSHTERWRSACRLELPPPDLYKNYRADFELGVSNGRQFQKEVRKHLGQGQILSPSGQRNLVDISDPEIFWRCDGMTVWFNAIELRHPASRDYADWLSPYLKPGTFKDISYPDFWLHEVSPDAMPFNRLTGLVSFYQLAHNISHGNEADQIHASHWFKSDLFITADVAFYKVLASIADNHFQDRPKPAIVDRSAGSCVDQIEALLRERLANSA